MDMFFWFLIAIAVVAYLISGGKRKRKGNVYRRKTDYQPPKRENYDRAPEVVREQSVAERQLVTVRGNEFYKRPLMNKSEYGVFCRLENCFQHHIVAIAYSLRYHSVRFLARMTSRLTWRLTASGQTS